MSWSLNVTWGNHGHRVTVRDKKRLARELREYELENMNLELGLGHYLQKKHHAGEIIDAKSATSLHFTSERDDQHSKPHV